MRMSPRNQIDDTSWFDEIADDKGILTRERYEEAYYEEAHVEDNPPPDKLFENASSLDLKGFISSMEKICGKYPPEPGYI